MTLIYQNNNTVCFVPFFLGGGWDGGEEEGRHFSLAFKALCFYRWFKLVKAVMFLLYGAVDSLLVVKDHRWRMLLIFH